MSVPPTTTASPHPPSKDGAKRDETFKPPTGDFTITTPQVLELPSVSAGEPRRKRMRNEEAASKLVPGRELTADEIAELLSTKLPPMHATEGKVKDSGKEVVRNALSGSSGAPQSRTAGHRDGKMIKTPQPKENPPYFDSFEDLQYYLLETRPQDRPEHIRSFIRASVKDRPPFSKTLQRLLTEAEAWDLPGGRKDQLFPSWDVLKEDLIEQAKQFGWAKDILAEMIASEDHDLKALADCFPDSSSLDVSEQDISDLMSQKSAQKAAVSKAGEEAWKARMEVFQKHLGSLDKMEKAISGQPVKQQAKGHSGDVAKDIAPTSHEASGAVYLTVLPGDRLILPNMPPDSNAIQGILTIVRSWTDQFIKFCSAEPKNSSHKRQERFESFEKKLLEQAESQPTSHHTILYYMIERMEIVAKIGLSWSSLFGDDEALQAQVVNGEITNFNLIDMPSNIEVQVGLPGSLAEASSYKPKPPDLGCLLGKVKTAYEAAFEAVSDNSKTPKLDALLHFRKSIEKLSSDFPLTFSLLLRINFDKMEDAATQGLPSPADLEWGGSPYALMFRGLEYEFDATKADVPPPRSNDQDDRQPESSKSKKKRRGKKKKSQQEVTSENQGLWSTVNRASPTKQLTVGEVYTMYVDAHEKRGEDQAEGGKYTRSFYRFLRFKEIILDEASKFPEAVPQTALDDLQKLEEHLRRNLPQAVLEWKPGMPLLTENIPESLPIDFDDEPESEVEVPVVQAKGPKNKRRRQKKKKNKGQETVLEKDLPSSSAEVDGPSFVGFKGANIEGEVHRDPGDHHCRDNWCNHSCSFQMALAETIATLSAESPLDINIKNELHLEMTQVKRRVDMVDSFPSEVKEPKAAESAPSNEIVKKNKTAGLKKGGVRKGSPSKTKPAVAAKPAPAPCSCDSTKIRTHLSTEEVAKLYPNVQELDRRIAELPDGPFFAFGRLDTPQLKRAAAVHILSSPRNYTAFMDCREQLNYLVACGDTHAALHSIEVEEVAEVVGEVHQEMTVLAKAKMKANHDEYERKNAPLTEKDLHDQKLAESAKKMREMEEKEKAIHAERDAKKKAVETPTINLPSDESLSLDMMKAALSVLTNGGGDGKNLSYNTFGPENPPTPQERRIIVQGLLQKPEMMASFIKNMNGVKEIKDNGDPKIAFFRNEARLLFETMKEFQPAPKPAGTMDPISGAPPTAAQKARLIEVYDVLKEMDTKFLNSKAEESEMSEELFLRLLSSLSTSSLEDPLWSKVAPLVQKYILTSSNRRHLARGCASEPSRLAGLVASKLQLDELAKNTGNGEIQGMADEAANLWRDVLDEQAKLLGKPPSTANQDKPVSSVVEGDTVKNFAATILQDLVAAYSKASSDKERYKLALKYIMAHPSLPNTQAEAAAFSSGAKHEQFMRYLAFLELIGNIPRRTARGESEEVSMLQKFKKEVEFVQTAIHRFTVGGALHSKGTASPSKIKPVPVSRPVSEVPETSQTITQFSFRAWECLHDKLASTDEQRKEANRKHNVPQGYVPSEFRDAAAFLLEYPVILKHFKTVIARAKAVPESKGDNELRKLQTVVFNLLESAIEAERLSPKKHGHVGSKSTGATPAPLKTFTSETLATYEAEYAKAITEAERQAVNVKFGLMLVCNPTSIRSAATQMLLDRSKVSSLARLKQKLHDDIEAGNNLERSEPMLGRLLMVEVAFNELTRFSSYNDGGSSKPPAATLKPVSSSPLSSLLAYEAAYNAASTDQEFNTINEKFNLPDGCSPEQIRDFLPKMLREGILPIAFYSIKVETEVKLEAGEKVEYNQKLLNRIYMADAAYRSMVLADPEYMKKIAADTSTHRYIPIIPSIERYEATFSKDPEEKRAINAMFMVPKDFSPELAREIAATDMMNRDKLSTFFKSKLLIEHCLKEDPNDYENQLFLNRSLLIEEAWRELMTGAPQYPTFEDGKPWIADQVKSNIDKFLVEDSYTEQELLAQAKDTLGTDGDLMLFDDHKKYIAFCAPHYPPAKKMLKELDRLEAIIQKLQADEVAKARLIVMSTSMPPTATRNYEYTPEELAKRRKDLADGFRRTQKSSLQVYEVRDKAKYLLSRPPLMSLFMEQRDIMERGAHANDNVNEKFMLKEMRKVYAEIEKVQGAKSEQARSSRLAPPPPAVVPKTAGSFVGLEDTEFPMAIGRAHAKAVLAAVPKPTRSVVPKSLTRPRSNAISQATAPPMPFLKSNPAITVTSAPGPSIPVKRLLAYSDPKLKISPDPSFQPKTPQLPQDIENATKAVTNAPVMAQKQVLAGLYAKSPKDYSAFKTHKSKFEESIKRRPDHWSIDDDVQASKELAMVKEIDSIVKELRMTATSEQTEEEKELIETAAKYGRQLERQREQIDRLQSKLDELMEIDIEESGFIPSKFIDDEVLPGDDKKKQTASGTMDAKILKAFKAGQKIRKNQRKANKLPAVAATTPAGREVSFCGDVFEKSSRTQMPVLTDPLQVIRFAMGKDPFAPPSPNAAVAPPREEFNGHDTSSDEEDGDLVATSSGYPPGPSTKDQSAEDQIPLISTLFSAISHANEAPDSGSIPGPSSASTQGIPGLNITAPEGKPGSATTNSLTVAPSSTSTTTPQLAPSLSDRVDDFLNGKYTFPEGTTPEARARGAAMNDIQRSILMGSALPTVPMKVVTKTQDIQASPKTLEYYSNLKLPPMTLPKNEQKSPAQGRTPPAGKASAAVSEPRGENVPDKVVVQANPHLYPAHFTRSQADYPAPEPRGLEFCPITGFPLPPPAPIELVITPAKEKLKEKEKKGKKDKKNALAASPPKAEEEVDALKQSLRIPITHEPRFCSVDLATEVRRQIDDLADAARSTREMVESYRRALDLPAVAPGKMESAVVIKEAEIFDALERTGDVYAAVREREEERVERLLRDARLLRGEVARAVDDVRAWGGEIEGRLGREEGVPSGVAAIKAVLDRGELGELDALLDDCKGLAGERRVMPLAVKRAVKRMKAMGERKAEMRRVVAGKKALNESVKGV